MDIILTGIARAGTTLSCTLLNKCPQVVALHEPMNPAELAALGTPPAMLARVQEFFREQRASLQATGTAASKVQAGTLPANSFASERGAGGLRTSIVTGGTIHFGKRLGPGFRLVIKHPNCFTALLPSLTGTFPCFAIIRNPLAVLLSWQSVDAPVHHGRLPWGEAFDAGLAAALAGEPDRLSRQMIILDWYFGQYARWLPLRQVIRYEEIVETRGRALRVIDASADFLDESLECRNRSGLYDPAMVRPLMDRLMATPGRHFDFYARDEIRHLCRTWEQHASPDLPA